MSVTACVVLLGCIVLSFMAFRAAVRTLEIRVRWWRLIAGLILLRISGAVLTPVLAWIEYALRSVLHGGSG